MHRLRLSDGRGQTVEFRATSTTLNNHINDAYLSYCSKYRHSAVILEICHRVHGWQPVYDQDGYCRMIQNPLKVDYQNLKKDIIHTLSIVDTWPSNNQKKLMEMHKQVRERQQDAQRRREAFKVVAGGRG